MDMCGRGLTEVLAKLKETTVTTADIPSRSAEIAKLLGEVESETILGRIAITKGKANPQPANGLLRKQLGE